MVSFLLNLNMTYPVYVLLVMALKETAPPITHALHVQLESMDQGGKSSIIGGIGLEMAQYLLKDQVLLHIVTLQAIISKVVGHGKQVVSKDNINFKN